MPSRYLEVKLGSSAIPAGDFAEQFVANVMLSIFAFVLDDIHAGQKHLSYAHSIAAALETEVQTYRSKNRIKTIRLILGTENEKIILMIPVIGERLVIPAIDLQRVAKHLKSHSSEQSTTALRAVEISYHDIRLRPARLKRSLATIMECGATDHLLSQAEDLLTVCLANRQKTVDFVDLAHDYLNLTHDFSSMGNYLIAGLALEQAAKVVDDFIDRNKEYGGMQSITEFKAKLQVLARELKLGDS